MTIEEATTIFNLWQEYQEIGDKLHQIFTTIPESFLPYPATVLEEALNIIAKHYFDTGDKETAKNIQEMLALQTTGLYLSSDSKGRMTTTDKPISDEEALRKMKKELDLILDNPDLLKVKLSNLERSRKSWVKFKSDL